MSITLKQSAWTLFLRSSYAICDYNRALNTSDNRLQRRFLLREVNYFPFSTSKLCLQPEENAKSIPILYKNELIEGKVLQAFSSSDVLLLIKGRRVMAKSFVPLRQGEILSLKVEKTTPIPTLKTLGIKFIDSNDLNMSLLLYALKENLWKSTFENIHRYGLPKEAVSSFKELITDLSMGLFLKSSPELLRDLIDKLGLNWEAKLKRILMGKKIDRAKILDKLIQGDLKGLSSRLLVFKEEGEDLLERFVSAIKNIQLLNHVGLKQDRKIFLPIPMQFPDGLFILGQLLIHLQQREKDSDTQTIINNNPLRITFLLEFSHLGPLRVDFTVNEKKIDGRFLVTNEEIKALIENNIPSLITTLKDKDFGVRSMVCQLKDHDIVKQSLIGELIQQEGNTISLVA